MDLVKLVGDQTVEALTGFVTATAEDLAEFGHAIAADAIRAVREGRPDIRAELADQVKAIGELHRIRTSGFTWDQIVTVAVSLAKVAFAVYNSKG